MTFISIVHYISIILELIIAVGALSLAIKNKKKEFCYGIALTFFIYVFYDLAKSNSWPISNNILYSLFFIATLSMLWVVYKIKN